jgi:hypothetical protein
MSVLDGSIGILPLRVLVEIEDWTRARHGLDEAGPGTWVDGDDSAR